MHSRRCRPRSATTTEETVRQVLHLPNKVTFTPGCLSRRTRLNADAGNFRISRPCDRAADGTKTAAPSATHCSTLAKAAIPLALFSGLESIVVVEITVFLPPVKRKVTAIIHLLAASLPFPDCLHSLISSTSWW